MMDPSSDVLEQITTIGHAMALAGMIPPTLAVSDENWPGPLAVAFMEGMGVQNGSPIEFLAANSLEDVHADINGLYIDTGNGQGLRLMRAGEKGTCKLVDRYCRLKLGLLQTTAQAAAAVSKVEALGEEVLELRSQTQEALAQATSAGSLAARAQAAQSTRPKPEGAPHTHTPAPSTERVVALDKVASQNLEGTCRKLTKEEIQLAYARWSAQYGRGKRPSPDEDPSEDQLAAVRHLIETGEVP